MNATSTQLGPEFTKQVPEVFFNAFDEGTKQTARMFWSILQSFLIEHWARIIPVLFIIFLLVSLKAVTGQWGSLGSFFYNFFYFGTLYLIGLIGGPEVFVSNFFGAFCAIVLYPVCYYLVGYILDKIGVLKYGRI